MSNNLLYPNMQKYACRLLVFGFVIAQSAAAVAAIVPPERLSGWQGSVGVPGGIPNRSTIFCNVKNAPYNAKGDGVSDDSGAIMNAINACPAGQVIYVPSGTYRMGTQVRVTTKSDWTLRGDGQGKTIFTGGGSGLFVLGDFGWSAGEWPVPVSITGGANKGSTSITVSSTSGLAVGQLMWVEQLNDGTAVFGYGSGGTGNPTSNSSAGSRLHDDSANLNQRVMVTGISGSTVSFSPPLNMGFKSSLSPKAVGFGSKHGPSNIGLESLTINGSSAGIGVWMMGCYASWLKDVELKGWGTFGFEIQDSCNIEIRECYVHEPATYDWSKGYPLQFDASNNSLIENNVFWHFQADLILQGCSSGNVFGYNCVFQAYNVYNGIGTMLDSFSGNHTPYPLGNLWEGNYGNEFHSDFYYGPSSTATLLRNYLTGTDPDIVQNRIIINLDSHQWSNSVVGNVLGSSGVSSPIFSALANKTITYANTTPLTWTYDSNGRNFSYSENVVYRLGYPFIGNNGTASTSLGGIDPVVRSSTIIHGNWDYATKVQNWDSNISDRTIPNSYYLSGKPSWFGNLPWPPYDPSNPTSATITSIPAGYRFIYGTNPPTAGRPADLPPVAAANASPKLGPAPLGVAFSSAGSADPEGRTLAYSWTFGDGATSSSANPSHNYQVAGSYSASLTVSDGVNSTTSTNITIRVTAAGVNQSPVAVATATPTSGPGPLTVSFSSAGSTDPEGTALTYSWNFGDGTTSAAANPSHSYAVSGTYSARLTISDGTNTVLATPVNIAVVNGANGLVAAYGFEEGAGTSAGDASGKGNDGEISSATWVTGKYGKALSFNGTSSVVRVNGATSLDLVTGVTLEAWVYPTAMNGYTDIIYKDTIDYFLVGSTVDTNAPAMGGTFASVPLYGIDPLPLNTWSHLAATYDGTDMKLSVNGVQVASRPQSGVIVPTAGGNLFIGGYTASTGKNWTGLIDEVRIYNRALSANEIQTDMNTPVVGTTLRPSPPQNIRVVSQ